MKKLISIVTAFTTVLWLSGLFMIFPVHAVTFADGDLAREADEFDVYIVKLVGDKQFKRLILNPDVFNMYGHLNWADIQVVVDGELADYTTSELIRADGDEKVYKLFPDGDVGTKKWVESLDCFTDSGFDWDSVYVINTFDRDSYTTAAESLCGGAVVSTGLSIALAIDSPAAATIPKSATSVGFVKVDFTAGSEGAVGITNLTFHRAGLGTVNDFDNLYLYEGAARLTDGRSVGAATNNVTFSGLTISIPAGETKSITLKADMLTPDTYDYNYFELVSTDSITSDASNVTGIFPIQGNHMVLSGAAEVGTITVAALADPANPKVGETGATVAKFSLAAASEDLTLNELRLIVKGTIDNDNLTNLILKRGTEELATDDALSAKGYMEFVLATPYAFEDGDTKNFSVEADVTGEDGDTIEIYLDENTDLVAIGSDYGYGCGVDKDEYDGHDADAKSDTASEAGQVTLVFNGPVAADVGKDTNDTVLMDFAITAQMFVTVKEMDVIFDGDNLGDNTTNTITDLKIKNKDTGVTIQGPDELTLAEGNAGTGTIDFTEDYDIQAGETLNLQITADIGTTADGVGDAEYYYATIVIAGLDIEDANRDTVSDIVPGGNIQGNTMTVAEAALTVTLSATPTSKTFVTGKTGVEAVGFNFKASEASDLEITDLILQGYYASASGAGNWGLGVNSDGNTYLKDVVSAVSIYYGTTKIAGPETVDDEGDVIFDGFSWSIPAGESKTLVVKADISTTAPYDDTDNVFGFDIEALSTDVTVYDSDGNSLTLTATYPNGGGTAANGTTIYQTVTATGTLATAVTSDQPRAAIVIAGNTGVVFNKVKFTSTNEAFVVEEITVSEAGDGAVSNIKQVTISYPTESGTRSQSMNLDYTSEAAVFTGATFYVPKDDNAVLTIKADLNVIADGAESGASLSFDFTNDTNGDFKAVGQSSSTILALAADVDSQVGKEMTLFKTKPTFAKQDIPNYTGVLIPTTQKVAMFTITADDNYDLTFIEDESDLKFHVIASTSAATEQAEIFSLYDWNDLQVATANVTFAVDSSDYALDFNFSEANVEIPHGQTKSFYVKVSLTDFSTVGAYIQLRLDDDLTENVTFVDDGGITERVPVVNTVPGLDIDFETFVRE